MKKFTAVIYLILVSTFFIYGQKTIVNGIITDKIYNEPIPFVNIYFKGTKIGTISDIDGRFHLSSYYGTDTVVASFIGFEKNYTTIEIEKKQNINIQLIELSTALEEIIVIPSDINPAHPIIKNVIKNKSVNNREKLDSYSYEAYNKIELDLNNFTENYKRIKTFKKLNFIFNHLDTSLKKPSLPVFISESLSDYYFLKDPKRKKEIIKSTKVSGIENESFMELTGEMYQQVNIYNNNISVFGKQFVSPISKQCLNFYKFYLTDSLFIDNNWCYQIDFIPKRKRELTFEGSIWINDTTYAVKKIKGYVHKEANINFIKELVFTQKFKQVEPEIWMLKKDELLIDFEWPHNYLFFIEKEPLGIYAKKQTTYKDFIINQPKEDGFYSNNKISINQNATNQSEQFWKENRHDSLTNEESFIYNMVDSLKEIPVIRTYTDVLQTLISGYKVFGKVELGEYTSLYTYNLVEGNRIRLSIRTSSSFSKKVELSCFSAYGLNDEEFKYGLGTRFFITKEPRRLVQAVYKKDVEQLGLSSNAFNNTGIVSSVFRRNPFNKMLFNEQLMIKYERFWEKGITSSILFRHSSLDPLGIINFYSIDNGTLGPIRTNEISCQLRFAIGEEFLNGEFKQLSLGTKHPTFSIDYTKSIPGFLNANLNYQKVKIDYSQEVKINLLGKFKYQIIAGKIWGNLPYPLLEIHPGNETWSFNKVAFNMMNIGEFISDSYIVFKTEHHFQGLLLNKIPLFYKYQIREVIGFQGVYGSLSDRHNSQMLLPSFSSNLKSKPYMEATAGLENIFKFLRIDCVWRLSYLNNTFEGIKVSPFGVRGTIQFEF
jgi:hypothetical protein